MYWIVNLSHPFNIWTYHWHSIARRRHKMLNIIIFFYYKLCEYFISESIRVITLTHAHAEIVILIGVFWLEMTSGHQPHTHTIDYDTRKSGEKKRNKRPTKQPKIPKWTNETKRHPNRYTRAHSKVSMKPKRWTMTVILALNSCWWMRFWCESNTDNGRTLVVDAWHIKCENKSQGEISWEWERPTQIQRALRVSVRVLNFKKRRRRRWGKKSKQTNGKAFFSAGVVISSIDFIDHGRMTTIN